jgi:hypothetical protein
VALCGTAEAVPFPIRFKSKIKIEVKGVGQECPTHTGNVKSDGRSVRPT